jgi:hypothetical protein
MIPVPGRLALRLFAGIGCALLLALLVHDRNHWKAKAAEYSQRLAAERAASAATVANYRAAAERARREDSENLARVRAEQAAINEGSTNDFESRIAAARARSGELRAKTGSAAADSGGRGSAPVPGVPAAAGAIAQGAGEDRLPQSERLIATEQAIQLDELIKWVRRQAAVRQ